MAQEQGAAGSGEEEPGAGGREVPDTPEMWGNNGLVGDGRYRLTHRLGRGGMAEVFAAEDVRLGRTVAVKLLRADLAQDPVSKARFTREAQSVAGLNHHAVVAVYDSGEEPVGPNMVPYIVMELVNGKTIRELLIDSEAPPAEQALIIVSGVLEALAYSHHHGIVHRDIKPANVIITDTGAVKVMDFGIARALHGAAQTMTQTGMVMGTPQYLSPEQALGKPIDTRSDLYAVGCLLFELLTLRPPFIGETPLAVVYQHVQDMPRLPSELAAAAPPELDGLVMRSLAKDPDDRFQSAEEMRGLVQYALRMLQEHGGHTGGLWNTGSVAGGGTPPMGTQTVAVPGARRDAPTSQYAAPMLMGNGAGDDDDERRPSGNGQRGRMILVALLALVAIGTGVLIAANLGGGEEDPGNTPADTGPTGPTETQDRETGRQSPSEDDEDDEEEPSEDDDFSPTDSGDDWTETESSTPTESESSTPTEPQTTPPTEEETTPPPEEETTPPEDTEGTTEGGGEEEGGTGTDEGGTDQGTDQGALEGTDQGGTDAGASNP
ncbi:protein kinase domain-containing protein [Streptomyces litchfieldiae]|uniref:non-specific serine/threonine protein kinase n=1 Tax=Streptomyces litchfieldiae TaxID=3075543 RepID=A0ABU2ML90_9ACTN|nr:protein kinase [Streptomyces sp. DSM 44938]MDT0342255.1 protein kinase [Streptomyces sp. DSM 44938]